MAKIQAVKCDQCGKEERDPGKTWIHLSAKCSSSHSRDQFTSGGLSLGNSATVNVTGAYEAQFVEKDFCSPTCAGNHLFGISSMQASSRSSAG